MCRSSEDVQELALFFDLLLLGIPAVDAVALALAIRVLGRFIERLPLGVGFMTYQPYPAFVAYRTPNSSSAASSTEFLPLALRPIGGASASPTAVIPTITNTTSKIKNIFFIFIPPFHAAKRIFSRCPNWPTISIPPSITSSAERIFAVQSSTRNPTFSIPKEMEFILRYRALNDRERSCVNTVVDTLWGK